MRDEDFDASDVLPELVDTSDDEGPKTGQPPSDDPADADELSAKVEAPPKGKRRRGILGLKPSTEEAPHGVVRVAKGSTWSPDI